MDEIIAKGTVDPPTKLNFYLAIQVLTNRVLIGHKFFFK